ncbi:small integral membrane protein 5, partial [Simochromis diagramma]|uniref:small integral membrane protein 5 n=1 Tax=Simochromis diagramma TaxID=43689 RepID=UPI001A7E4FA4
LDEEQKTCRHHKLTYEKRERRGGGRKQAGVKVSETFWGLFTSAFGSAVREELASGSSGTHLLKSGRTKTRGCSVKRVSSRGLTFFSLTPAEVSMDQQLQDIFRRVWTKLQALPEATPVEVGAFAVLLLFIATVLFMILLSCIHCCCFTKPKHQPSRVQPLHNI